MLGAALEAGDDLCRSFSIFFLIFLRKAEMYEKRAGGDRGES